MTPYEAKNAEFRAIIDRAVGDLIGMGLQPDDAAKALALHGLLRMPDLQARRSLLTYIDPVEFLDPAAGPCDPNDDEGATHG